MAWIESHTDLRAHKKLKPLCEELGIGRAQAIGHLHMLWWWTLDNREYGNLDGLFDKDIAIAADWQGDPKRFIKALKKSGWITKNDEVNDWMHYAGRLINERIRTRRKRVDLRNDPLHDTGHDTGQTNGASAATKPNRTQPNRTVKEKTGFFNEKEEQILLNDIAINRNIDPNSESAHHRLKEICGELGKIKGVDNALALARHKARNQ